MHSGLGGRKQGKPKLCRSRGARAQAGLRHSLPSPHCVLLFIPPSLALSLRRHMNYCHMTKDHKRSVLAPCVVQTMCKKTGPSGSLSLPGSCDRVTRCQSKTACPSLGASRPIYIHAYVQPNGRGDAHRGIGLGRPKGATSAYTPTRLRA